MYLRSLTTQVGKVHLDDAFISTLSPPDLEYRAGTWALQCLNGSWDAVEGGTLPSDEASSSCAYSAQLYISRVAQRQEIPTLGFLAPKGPHWNYESILFRPAMFF